jgi:hypothetical protein
MPTYRGPGPNATVVFNPIRTSPGAPGFLLAYASEIPPDEAVFSRNKKKHEAFKSSKSGEKFMTRYRQIKGTANNRKHFKVDMRMGKEGARNYTNGLIQLESSGASHIQHILQLNIQINLQCLFFCLSLSLHVSFGKDLIYANIRDFKA